MAMNKTFYLKTDILQSVFVERGMSLKKAQQLQTSKYSPGHSLKFKQKRTKKNNPDSIANKGKVEKIEKKRETETASSR